MYRSDTLAAAEALSTGWSEERTARYWDRDRTLGAAFRARLGLEGIAWDVYCLYERGVRWEGAAPPPPAFWMMQTGDPRIDRRRLLDAQVFSERVGEALSRS